MIRLALWAVCLLALAFVAGLGLALQDRNLGALALVGFGLAAALCAEGYRRPRL